MEAIKLVNISKRFPGVQANDHISLAIEEGEIHAIVGENGAGKTTLMRILYGLYQPDEGDIFIREKQKSFGSPLDAIHAGIGMVHQFFELFPDLSVTENIVFGDEPSKFGFFDKKTAIKEIQDLAALYGFQLDPTALIKDLPVGVRQRVEILKTLYRKGQILILDEPTAVLTPQECDDLFTILRNLTKQGRTIVFITHKLNEVMRISDNITVLRGGKVTASLQTSKTSPEEISRNMVGRNILLDVEKKKIDAGNDVLKVSDLSIHYPDGRPAIKSVNFSVRSNEIVGIAGVAGNGQTELIEAIAGLRRVAGGQILLDGNDITNVSVSTRRSLGMAYIPEDRDERGLAVRARINENLIMNFQNSKGISKKRWLNQQGIIDFATELITKFSIQTASQFNPASTLSGGNQQRIVLARELTHQAHLIIAEQPTRGIDITASEFVYQQLVKYRDEGHAILLVSADLNEVMSLSDRILVMFEGKIMGEVNPQDTTEDAIGLLMAGFHAKDNEQE